MGLSAHLTSAALLLFLLAAVLLVQGIWRKSAFRLLAAAVVVLFLVAGYFIFLRFITSM